MREGHVTFIFISVHMGRCTINIDIDYKKTMHVYKKYVHGELDLEYDCRYFLKYFSFKNVLKLYIYIYILKKLFLKSAHQNDLKTQKIYINLKQIKK